MHLIPLYNGFCSEEDFLLNVLFLDLQGKTKEYICDKFKRDKHVMRFLAKLLSSNPSDEKENLWYYFI